LNAYREQPDVIVLALPRGGVPVGFEVARALHARLDVFMVRKLGVPGHEELAMGAIATGGVRVLNREVVGWLGIPQSMIDQSAAAEVRELERRGKTYRGGRPPLDVSDQRVILVDDGLATGATMRAAVEALRHMAAAQIVVAVPVAAKETVAELGEQVDDLICLVAPERFQAVGQWYDDFGQVSDDEVKELLQRAQREWALPAMAHPGLGHGITERR
jgi:predicted phosphoribosyltransferase